MMYYGNQILAAYNDRINVYAYKTHYICHGLLKIYGLTLIPKWINNYTYYEL